MFDTDTSLHDSEVYDESPPCVPREFIFNSVPLSDIENRPYGLLQLKPYPEIPRDFGEGVQLKTPDRYCQTSINAALTDWDVILLFIQHSHQVMKMNVTSMNCLPCLTKTTYLTAIQVSLATL